MKLWPVAPFFHFFNHFWFGLLLHPPKSDKKMKKKGNWSECHFSEVTSYKIHTLVTPWFPQSDHTVGKLIADAVVHWNDA